MCSPDQRNSDYLYLVGHQNRTCLSEDETFEAISRLAIDRLLSIVDPKEHLPPPFLFPRAEDTYFYHEIQSGEVRTEYDRMLYMANKFPERGVPISCSKILNLLLEEAEVLKRWSDYGSALTTEMNQTKLEALAQMQPHLPAHGAMLSKQNFWRDPVSYETDTQVPKQLWARSLQEMASSMVKDDFTTVKAFLRIHSFLKDPAGALHPSAASQFEVQYSFFLDLWTRFKAHYGALNLPNLGMNTYHRLLAQMALESSYLALPDMKNIEHVVVQHELQMSYFYVDIHSLPRSEFSVPSRVSELVCELLDNTARLGRCEMAPLTIAYAVPLEETNKPFKIIIDGNNRITSLVLLHFLSCFQDLDACAVAMMDDYCKEHSLGIKWLIDLREALEFLIGGAGMRVYLAEKWHTVKRFGSVVSTPALLAQEENFFTMCMRKGSKERPVLLQPMHQTFYNDDTLCIAFRGKAGQVSLQIRQVLW